MVPSAPRWGVLGKSVGNIWVWMQNRRGGRGGGCMLWCSGRRGWRWIWLVCSHEWSTWNGVVWVPGKAPSVGRWHVHLGRADEVVTARFILFVNWKCATPQQIYRVFLVSPRQGTVAFDVASHLPAAEHVWICAAISTPRASVCCRPQLVTWGPLLARRQDVYCRVRSREKRHSPPLCPKHPAPQHVLSHKQHNTHTQRRRVYKQS